MTPEQRATTLIECAETQGVTFRDHAARDRWLAICKDMFASADHAQRARCAKWAREFKAGGDPKTAEDIAAYIEADGRPFGRLKTIRNFKTEKGKA